MIRTATPDDAPAIAAIWNRAITDTTITFNPVRKTPADVAGLLHDDSCLVWDEGGQIGGFARFFQFRGGEGYRFTAEHTIMLRDDAQGRGIGTGLMRALFARAKDAGMHSLFAGVSAENPQGQAFHAALGFQVVAVLPQVGFKFDRWLDLVLMQKML